MLDKIDHAIEILGKAKTDKRTFVMVVGCAVSFGVAVGAIAIYERLIKELDDTHGKSFFERERRSYFDEDHMY